MKTRLAIIGLGAASEPHALALGMLADRAEVVVAATRDPRRAAGYRARFGTPVTTDIASVIDDPNIEAVLVLTPPGTHLELGERLFAAGKHVLVEKPLELTSDRAARLVAAGRAAGRRLGVVLQHRFRPASRRLAALLAEGSLGDVEAASMTVPWWRPQSYYDVEGRGTKQRDGGGVLLTQAIHTLDLFRSLVGVSQVNSAVVRTTGIHRMETEDFVAALVETGNGAPGVIMATTAAYPGRPEAIDIVCRGGTAALRGASLTVSRQGQADEVFGSDEPTGGGASIMNFSPEAHRVLLVDFLDAIAEGRDPIASGEEALQSQRLIEAILARGAERPTSAR